MQLTCAHRTFFKKFSGLTFLKCYHFRCNFQTLGTCNWPTCQLQLRHIFSLPKTFIQHSYRYEKKIYLPEDLLILFQNFQIFAGKSANLESGNSATSTVYWLFRQSFGKKTGKMVDLGTWAVNWGGNYTWNFKKGLWNKKQICVFNLLSENVKVTEKIKRFMTSLKVKTQIVLWVPVEMGYSCLYKISRVYL